MSRSLRLHYCKEEFCLGDKKISSAAHPMISFSEYNLATINDNNITYGKFGIAFTKSWVNKHKIHPVLYIDKNSVIANSLADLLKARRKNAATQLSPNIRLSIMTIKCFTKNAFGYNSYFNQNNFDFRSENEWRFVPTKKQIEGKLISQDRRKYIAKQNLYNSQLEKYPLVFTENDIEYIYVETEKQILEVKALLPIDEKKIRLSKWNVA
ncbi:abortive infection system antitoxin AbiGi family protein [Spirosoma aerophilum]